MFIAQKNSRFAGVGSAFPILFGGLAISPGDRPRWDAQARRLWWGGQVVKRLLHVAANQNLVLAKFETAGWPARFDDPLLRVAGRNAKTRRRETIKSLNLGLAAGTIRFYSDGTGGGIRWEAVA